MLKMKKGCIVPFPERLQPSYETGPHGFLANVGADQIDAMVRHFLAINDDPIFFILELPQNLRNENPETLHHTFHKEVYYLDGCTRERALSVLDRTGELLIQDGISSFGFGCHGSGDEIMSGKYNVVTVYTSQPQRYREANFFAARGIREVDRVVTAWDTFDQEHPGQARLWCEEGGRDAYSLPEELKEWGLYLAELREDT